MTVEPVQKLPIHQRTRQCASTGRQQFFQNPKNQQELQVLVKKNFNFNNLIIPQHLLNSLLKERDENI